MKNSPDAKDFLNAKQTGIYVLSDASDVQSVIVCNSSSAARVHLVLPKREMFSREEQKPSASVIVKMDSDVCLSHSVELVSGVELHTEHVGRLRPFLTAMIYKHGEKYAGPRWEEMSE